MDWKQMQVAFAIAGKDMVKAMEDASEEIINQPVKDAQASIDNLVKELDATKDTAQRKILSDRLEELNKTMDQASVRQKGFQDALADYQRTGMVGQLQQYRDLLTGSVAQMMESVKENTGTGANFTAALEVLKNVMGVSPELIKAIQLSTQDLENQFNTLGKIFDSDAGKTLSNDKAALAETIKLVNYGKVNKDNPEILSELETMLRDSGEKAGMQGKEANEYAHSMVKLISTGAGSDEIISNLEAMLSGENKNTKKFDKPNAKRMAQIVDLEKKYSKLSTAGFDVLSKQDSDLISSTTSIEDYMDIAKNSLKYIASKDVSGMTAMMLKSVMGIAGDVSLLASDKKQKRDKKLEKSFETTDVVNGKDTSFGELIKKTAEAQKKFTDLVVQTKQEQDPVKKEELKNQKDKARDNFIYLQKRSRELTGRITEDMDPELEKQFLFKRTEAEKQAKYDVLLKDIQDAKGVVAAGDNSDEAKKKRQNAIDAYDAQLKKDKEDKEKNTTTSVNQDFKSLRGGLALLDKGDMAFNPSKGISGSKGSLAEDVLTKMGLFDAPMAKGLWIHSQPNTL